MNLLNDFRWQPGSRIRMQKLGQFFALGVLIIFLAWWKIFRQTYSGVSVFSAEAFERAWDFLQKLVGSGDPAYARGSEWQNIFREMRETLEFSLAGAVLAGTGALFLTPFSTHANPAWLKHPLRILFTMTRTVPELIFAFILLLAFGPGALGVSLAIAIHNFGVMGRLFGGLTDANPAPSGSRFPATGAGKIHSFIYGDMTLLAPQFLTLWLNRLEVIIRSTVVLGFVASAGLGLHLRLALSGRRFTEVALVLMAYLILVVAVDLVSAGLRRLIR